MNDPRPGLPSIGRTRDELRSDCLRLLAHDLNNPLTAIRILAEMLRDEISDPEARQDVIDILEAADLAGALMDGLSSMARVEDHEEEFTWFPIDLVEVLRQSVDRPALRRHIKLDLPREMQMGGDRMALQRAFTDVLVNARRLVDGRLTIPVGATQVDGVVAPPGLWVRHRHRDNSPALPGVAIAGRDADQEIALLASVPVTEGDWRPLDEGEIVVVAAGEVVSRQR
jgi:signal transduction histidine kinase